MKIKQRVALVTGASSGIGKATAERLATAGYKVYGTSRRTAIAAQGDQPRAVADVVLKAATAPRPKLRYSVGRVASMRMLRRFAPAGVVDGGIRRNLRLDAPVASPTPVLS